MNYTLSKEYVLLDGIHEMARACWNGEEWEITCNHEDMQYGDDDERGECLICGAECDWGWQLDEQDGKEVWVREPHEWHYDKEGLLQKLINEEVYGKKHQNGNNGGEHKETVSGSGEGREH